MGATYTRQSSAGIVDGGVIEATDLNNEFDQLLATFVANKYYDSIRKNSFMNILNK